MNATTHSNETIRKVILHCQQLSNTVPNKPTADSIISVVSKIRALQIDTLQMVRRSHFLALWSRIGTYDEKLLNELKLNDSVVFLRNIPEKLKFSLIASSNLFLMPTIIDKNSIEGFGISFIEAASYGVASIGGKDGGSSDAISHSNTGLICDGNDLNSIYESILNFFNIKHICFRFRVYWDKM